jgi:hypothetical protein
LRRNDGVREKRRAALRLSAVLPSAHYPQQQKGEPRRFGQKTGARCSARLGVIVDSRQQTLARAVIFR